MILVKCFCYKNCKASGISKFNNLSVTSWFSLLVQGVIKEDLGSTNKIGIAAIFIL